MICSLFVPSSFSGRRMGGERRIVAVWWPHWAIERLERDLARRARPLRVPEKPRALAMPGVGGLRVTARNELADAAGIRPGQMVSDATALCPGLELHSADREGDRKGLVRLAGWCGRYTPWTALDPQGIGDEPDGILLDITGCDHLFGGEAKLLEELRRRLQGFGLTTRAAIASTRGAAWALARFGNQPALVLPVNGEVDALRSLPVAALRLNEAIVNGLMRLGLKKIGDLYGKPRAPVTARFGPEVSRRLDEALGFEPEPISPELPPVFYRASITFSEGLTRNAHIEDAVKRIAADLCEVLEREHQGARRLELQLFRVDGEVTRLQAGTGIASHDAFHLSRLFREKLAQLGDDFDTGFGVEALTLSCLAVDELKPAQETFENESSRAQALEQFIDRLSNRFGADRVLRLEPRASHIPERAAVAVPALHGHMPAMQGWKTYVSEQMASVLGGSLPRPLRLLPSPEAVDVMAEVPEGPPRIFRWRRISHQVARAEGPERLSPEWWREGKHRTRDYYRVEDIEGRRFWLYRDGLYHRDNEGPRWYLHGVFE
ncbi:nucleotidyltransferase/DNA polymerase [Parvibaculum lavamentivorans DS-1]|uniref:DNA-directed DNA polymerase n=2 Tax=Parvibaculum lavamentivorans TaxID=256618 RepID=A7HW56_PARL1|nr:nucleotidyltransferase/DNA polymerase [Parvibaculum lavamentivorans DS-1]